MCFEDTLWYYVTQNVYFKNILMFPSFFTFFIIIHLCNKRKKSFPCFNLPGKKLWLWFYVACVVTFFIYINISAFCQLMRPPYFYNIYVSPSKSARKYQIFLGIFWKKILTIFVSLWLFRKKFDIQSLVGWNRRIQNKMYSVERTLVEKAVYTERKCIYTWFSK